MYQQSSNKNNNINKNNNKNALKLEVKTMQENKNTMTMAQKSTAIKTELARAIEVAEDTEKRLKLAKTEKLSAKVIDNLHNLLVTSKARAKALTAALVDAEKLAKIENRAIKNAEKLAKIEADKLAKIEAKKPLSAEFLAQVEADKLAKIEADQLAQAEATAARVELEKNAPAKRIKIDFAQCCNNYQNCAIPCQIFDKYGRFLQNCGQCQKLQAKIAKRKQNAEKRRKMAQKMATKAVKKIVNTMQVYDNKIDYQNFEVNADNLLSAQNYLALAKLNSLKIKTCQPEFFAQFAALCSIIAIQNKQNKLTFLAKIIDNEVQKAWNFLKKDIKNGDGISDDIDDLQAQKLIKDQKIKKQIYNKYASNFAQEYADFVHHKIYEAVQDCGLVLWQNIAKTDKKALKLSDIIDENGTTLAVAGFRAIGNWIKCEETIKKHNPTALEDYRGNACKINYNLKNYNSYTTISDYNTMVLFKKLVILAKLSHRETQIFWLRQKSFGVYKACTNCDGITPTNEIARQLQVDKRTVTKILSRIQIKVAKLAKIEENELKTILKNDEETKKAYLQSKKILEEFEKKYDKFCDIDMQQYRILSCAVDIARQEFFVANRKTQTMCKKIMRTVYYNKD